MSGGTTQESSGTQSSVQQIPQWMSNAGQQNYALAQQIAERPLQQYQGQMVADVSPQTQQSWNTAAGSGTVGDPQYAGATGGFQGVLSANPSMITSGQISDTNLKPYMDPYTNEVINKTLPIMQQQLGLTQNQQANAASSAGAFGGSRQGVQAGVTQAQGAQNMAQMAAQLRSQGYQQATGLAQTDIANRMAADKANQAAQLQKMGYNVSAAQGLAGVGGALQDRMKTAYAMQSGAGTQQQQQAQNQINAQMAKFSQAFNYPQQGLGLMLSALGMTPHDVSSYGQSTQETTTPTNYGALAVGGLGDLASIGKMMGVSDPKVKKNITSLGADPTTGVPIKAFNYKGAAPGTPKVIGPLAPDVQKAVPGSVAKIGGIKHVFKPALAAATPSVAHLPAFSGNNPMPSGPLAASSPGVAKAIGTMAPQSNPALTSARAGARGRPGALANTKRRPVVGALG